MKTAFSTAALLVAAASATAAFQDPAWPRPTSDAEAAAGLTTFQHWDRFTSVSGPNAPDVAEVNPNGVANAFDAAAPGSASFLTGGNIYSITGIIKPRIEVPLYPESASATTFVQLQLQVTGIEINTDDLTVNGTPLAQIVGADYTELSRVDMGQAQFPGAPPFTIWMIQHKWTFAVNDASSLLIDFGWSVPSASLQEILLDTQSIVPEPATLSIFAGAALILARRNRR